MHTSRGTIRHPSLALPALLCHLTEPAVGLEASKSLGLPSSVLAREPLATTLDFTWFWGSELGLCACLLLHTETVLKPSSPRFLRDHRSGLPGAQAPVYYLHNNQLKPITHEHPHISAHGAQRLQSHPSGPKRPQLIVPLFPLTRPAPRHDCPQMPVWLYHG